MADIGGKDLAPLNFLQDHNSKRRNGIENDTGLIILNSPISSPDLLNRVWANTSYRVCADGGANRLFDLFERREMPLKESCIPNEIHGDLDSLRDDVRQYYEKNKVPVTKDDDQYSTDFEKCIGRIIATLPSLSNIVVLGSLSGRVDQGIGLLSEIYRQQKQHPAVTFWLFSENSVSFILGKGQSKIATPVQEGLITENAGLLPIFGPATITIQGFEWDVTDWETELGAQMSTSNHIKSEYVTVKTDRELLFTIERLESSW
ncbi:thiamine pyrophosphokinase-like protein [Elsinoe australis]|uniref:Thiamine pyrophosphokinase n=1 Tax=Elsinoe australis TaxID=40998 RepID=A0A4U7AQI9_9PEZI|nr:thiamine pyrophosphokinase-like protein [Elsinoe australis]